MRKKLTIPLLTAAAVAVLLGTILFITHLRDDAPPPAEQGPPRVAMIGTDDGAQVRLSGRLPSGEAPRQSHVYRDDDADKGTVAALADALGLQGTLRQTRRGWILDDGERRLTVAHGVLHEWNLSGGPEYPGGPACPHDEIDTRSACAGTPSVEPTSPPPDEAKAMEATADLRRHLDLGDAVSVPVVQAFPDGRYDMMLAPRVGELPTWGVETRLSVGGDGRIYRGSGVLAHPRAGDVYPVLGVEDALRRLRENPGPATNLCRVDPSNRGGGCVEPDPIDATSADAGLARTVDENRRVVLAPAWLLHRAGGRPVAALAVSDRYVLDAQAGKGTPSGDPGEGHGPASAVPASPPPSLPSAATVRPPRSS